MEYLCVGFVILAIIIGIVGSIFAEINRQKQLAAARQAYRACLAQLKTDPNNPELRQQTLQLGRVYSKLTRDKKGVTVYDEVALKNDIDAACAGAVSVQNRSVEDRLTKLQQLHAAGHITDDEYRQRRQGILDDV